MCCASVMWILCVAAGSTRFKTSLILVPPHEMPCRQYFENLLRCSSICEGPNFYVIITPLAGDFVKNFQWAIEQHVFSNLAVLWPRTEALVHSCLLPGANKQINVKLKNLCTRPLDRAPHNPFVSIDLNTWMSLFQYQIFWCQFILLSSTIAGDILYTW